MKIYLSGQTNFGNRGCEALVRSTTGLLSKVFNDLEILVPTYDKSKDQPQWPDSEKIGVKFVDAQDIPASLIWWNRFATRIKWFKALTYPRYTLPENIAKDILGSDALIMTGGDVISLEYGLASLFYWSLQVDFANKHNIPTILWAASVGPFSSDPIIEKKMIVHLKKYSAITVRETESFKYLQSLGISNVKLVADPAFTLLPEPFDVDELTFGNSDNILGFNLSPLVRGYRPTEESRRQFDEESVNFIRHVIENTDLSVLLIPHVDPLDGDSENSDSSYMKTLLAQLGDQSGRVKIAPRTLNACQLKYLISQCRFFIGARTHATVAALSTYVPTISIAYSVKAKGINKDIFGHTDYVLETPKVAKQTLLSALELLLSKEAKIKDELQARIPKLREDAHLSVQEFVQKCTAK